MGSATKVREDKLADTAPNKPLALTLGAAAVTLAVIIGVLAGPSLVTCFNSEDGMGVCLRGKMTDAGILPQPAVASTDAATPAPAEPAPVTAEPETAVGEPVLDTAPPEAAPASSDGLIAATFGLLRAEPDGSVVIAGSGTPGSEIEVYSNDALLGTTTVEPSGDWVLVPDAPIVPGGTEITLAEAGKTGRAAQSFVVVISDDKSSEPLVVASTPGAASEILQGLDTPAEAPAPDIAVAEASPAPAATPAPAPVQPKPATPAPAAAPATAAAAPAAETPAPVETPAPAAQVETAPVTPPPVVAPAPAAPAATASEPAPAPEPQVAATQPAATTPAPAAPAPQPPASTAMVSIAPTIDAIEIEGDKTFFAGAGTDGAAIRLYVDDSFVADTTVADGRWLVEAGKVLTKPQQRVRIDMLAPGSAEVAARAEVDFSVELPASDTPTAVAEAAATPPTAETPAAVAATEPVPTLVAVSVGGPDAERFASGKAIIRRGDNLWTIARRVYGEGIRYTTIYEANTGQIRDPNQIYPGQVFALPN